MKKFIIAAILIYSGCTGLKAADKPLAVFNKANQLYAQGQFKQVIEIYRSLETQKQVNSALYYNLGNALYRDGQVGGALLNYERAWRLSPRDSDIRGNMAFVRQQVREPQPGFSQASTRFINGLLSLNELTFLTSFMFLMCLAGAGWYLLRRSTATLAGLLCAGAAFLTCGAWLYFKIDREILTSSAIVMTGPAEVRNGPGADNSVAFNLPEGRTVIVLGETDGWTAVGLETEGLKGWIEKRFIEKI